MFIHFLSDNFLDIHLGKIMDNIYSENSKIPLVLDENEIFLLWKILIYIIE